MGNLIAALPPAATSLKVAQRDGADVEGLAAAIVLATAPRASRGPSWPAVARLLRANHRADAIDTPPEETAMTTIDIDPHDGVLRLRLRSEGPNALDASAVATLRSHLQQAAQAGEPVLLSSASRFFCNGLDLAWALGSSRAELRAFFLAMGDLVLELLELPVPVACAMTGHAVGAGKSLVLGCDVRVGATAKCLLGAPEVKLGVPNPVFADRLLRAMVSDRVANDLLYSGRLVTAEEAVTLGLLDGAVALDAVEQQALQRLQALAAQPRRAWAATKRQRSLDLCAAIRNQLESHIDSVVLEHWFGDEAQRLLHAAAASLARA